MTPRQLWFKQRVSECIKTLAEINEIQDWEKFKTEAHHLACELLYVTTEWDKYYRDVNK